MAGITDNWVRIFDIPTTSKHRKGFTIYKVISMLYPKSCPEAVTKVTVWKRYNDFKKLHREMKSQYKTLQLKAKFPSLPNASYFKRFDDNTIQERRQNILNFLEFTASHPDLYTSNVFVKFFETSYTPTELLQSNINSIRAELQLPAEPEYCSFHSNSDDDHTLSDTDSVLTFSSISPSVQEHLPDPLQRDLILGPKLTNQLSSDLSRSNSHVSHDSLSIAASIMSLDGAAFSENQAYSTPPNTPSSASTYSPHYILEAAQYITQAVDYEVEKKYEDAFVAYKAGIDILLKNVKEETNVDRKEMVRHKTEKYLLRAEKIYNVHLSSEIQNIKKYAMDSKDENDYTVNRPLSDLYKYKVIRVIASGMLVLHSELQQLYYIKVIHKTSKFSKESLILPVTVPFMIKLHNYYNCENALFLVLEYCSGMRLWDYIQQKSFNSDEVFQNEHLFSHFTALRNSDNNLDGSDAESDHSYSDLINDYATKRQNNKASDVNVDESDPRTSNCDNQSDIIVSQKLNFIDNACSDLNEIDVEDDPGKSSDNLEVTELLKKSRKILSAVDDTLNRKDEVIVNRKPTSFVVEETDTNVSFIKEKSRKSSDVSDRSQCEDLDVMQNLVPLQDVVKWTAQLLLALEKLHQHGVVCCDLQSKNLLIDECGDIILTYMCTVSENSYAMYHNENNLLLAPEFYSFQPVTAAVDWWSFGTVLYELLVGMPLNLVHPQGFTTYTSLKIPRYVSVEGRSLLKQLLTYESSERLGCGYNGIDDIKSHPFFSSVSWDSLHSKFEISNSCKKLKELSVKKNSEQCT